MTNYPLMGVASATHMTYSLIFGTPAIYLEWVKLGISNLVC